MEFFLVVATRSLTEVTPILNKVKQAAARSGLDCRHTYNNPCKGRITKAFIKHSSAVVNIWDQTEEL